MKYLSKDMRHAGLLDIETREYKGIWVNWKNGINAAMGCFGVRLGHISLERFQQIVGKFLEGEGKHGVAGE